MSIRDRSARDEERITATIRGIMAREEAWAELWEKIRPKGGE
jgi:hypothetical protein